MVVGSEDGHWGETGGQSTYDGHRMGKRPIDRTGAHYGDICRKYADADEEMHE